MKDKIMQPFLAISKDKFTVDTIEILKTRREFRIGDVVELNGYYSAGDGAGHKRKIEQTDDGSGAQLANGLWANIVHSGEVNVSWFGARGDGLTDDTGTIQKAIDYCMPFPSAKKIKIHAGKFLISKPLFLPVSLLLEGETLNNQNMGTIIIKTNNSKDVATGYNVEYQGISNSVDSVITLDIKFGEGYISGTMSSGGGKGGIKNITLKSLSNSDYGIFTAYTSQHTMSDVNIYDVKEAWYSGLAWKIDWLNIKAENVDKGFTFDLVVNGVNTSTIMKNVYVHTYRDYAFKFKKHFSVHLDTPIFENGVGQFLVCEDRSRVTISNPHAEVTGFSKNMLTQNFFENSLIACKNSNVVINGGTLHFYNEPTGNYKNSCFHAEDRSIIMFNGVTIYVQDDRTVSAKSLMFTSLNRSKIIVNGVMVSHAQKSMIGGGEYRDSSSSIYINYDKPSEFWLLKRLGYPCDDVSAEVNTFNIYVDFINGSDYNNGDINHPKQNLDSAIEFYKYFNEKKNVTHRINVVNVENKDYNVSNLKTPLIIDFKNKNINNLSFEQSENIEILNLKCNVIKVAKNSNIKINNLDTIQNTNTSIFIEDMSKVVLTGNIKITSNTTNRNILLTRNGDLSLQNTTWTGSKKIASYNSVARLKETGFVLEQYEGGKVYQGNTAYLSELNTPYHVEKMKQENVYNDFISYMDSKTEYDNHMRNQDVVDGVSNLIVLQEPQPSQALLKFKEKYLG